MLQHLNNAIFCYVLIYYISAFTAAVHWIQGWP